MNFKVFFAVCLMLFASLSSASQVFITGDTELCYWNASLTCTIDDVSTINADTYIGNSTIHSIDYFYSTAVNGSVPASTFYIRSDGVKTFIGNISRTNGGFSAIYGIYSSKVFFGANGFIKSIDRNLLTIGTLCGGAGFSVTSGGADYGRNIIYNYGNAVFPGPTVSETRLMCYTNGTIIDSGSSLGITGEFSTSNSRGFDDFYHIKAVGSDSYFTNGSIAYLNWGTAGTDVRPLLVHADDSFTSSAVFFTSDVDGNGELYFSNETNVSQRLTATVDDELIMHVSQNQSTGLAYLVFKNETTNDFILDIACPFDDSPVLGEKGICQTTCSDGTVVGQCSTSKTGFLCNTDGILVFDPINCEDVAANVSVSPPTQMIIRDEATCLASELCSHNSLLPLDEIQVQYAINGLLQKGASTSDSLINGSCTISVNSTNTLIRPNVANELMTWNEASKSLKYSLSGQLLIGSPYVEQTGRIDCNATGLTNQITNLTGFFVVRANKKVTTLDDASFWYEGRDGEFLNTISDKVKPTFFAQLEASFPTGYSSHWDSCRFNELNSTTLDYVSMTQTGFEADGIKLVSAWKYVHNETLSSGDHRYIMSCRGVGESLRMPTMVSSNVISVVDYCDSDDAIGVDVMFGAAQGTEFLNSSTYVRYGQGGNTSLPTFYSPDNAIIGATFYDRSQQHTFGFDETINEELDCTVIIFNASDNTQTGFNITTLSGQRGAFDWAISKETSYHESNLTQGNYTMAVYCEVQADNKCFETIQANQSFQYLTSPCAGTSGSCGQFAPCKVCNVTSVTCPDGFVFNAQNSCNWNRGCSNNYESRLGIYCREHLNVNIIGDLEDDNLNCANKGLVFNGELKRDDGLKQDWSNFSCDFALGSIDSNASSSSFFRLDPFKLFDFNEVNLGSSGKFKFVLPESVKDSGYIDCNERYSLIVECEGYIDGYTREIPVQEIYPFRIATRGDCFDENAGVLIHRGDCASTKPLMCNDDGFLVEIASQCGCKKGQVNDIEILANGTKIEKENCVINSGSFYMDGILYLMENPLVVTVIFIIMVLIFRTRTVHQTIEYVGRGRR